VSPKCDVAGSGLPMPLNVPFVTSGRLRERVRRAVVLRGGTEWANPACDAERANSSEFAS
jgi:hypothetical protein